MGPLFFFVILTYLQVIIIITNGDIYIKSFLDVRETLIINAVITATKKRMSKKEDLILSITTEIDHIQR